MLADYETYVQINNVLPIPEAYNWSGRIFGDALRGLRQ